MHKGNVMTPSRQEGAFPDVRERDIWRSAITRAGGIVKWDSMCNMRESHAFALRRARKTDGGRDARADSHGH